ncbi:TolC family protein [Belliella marina]|uniref:TolC family protein n=1 Tax=Belliella marina TaxID=1644146 RepID=A0ABW4VNY0_9BACT
MKNKPLIIIIFPLMMILGISGCKVFDVPSKQENKTTPESYPYPAEQKTSRTEQINWHSYFDDPNLVALIDSALLNNQELNIVQQELAINSNEVRARKGEYLPFVSFMGGAGIEKVGRFTRNGAVEENLELKPGKAFPEPVPDFMLGTIASWELDVWKKLRNSKKSALSKYLASVEGKNFMVTNLVAEIANAYYELMALDNILETIQSNISIQTTVYEVLKQQKEAAKVTQLAVNRFEAQVLNTKNLQFEVLQKIIETENRINLLVGRFPESIPRSSKEFKEIEIESIYSGIPSDLLTNRPDIRQAELELVASKLDVSIAKANFYPSFTIKAGIGFQSFNPSFLLNPESMLYSFAGDLAAPLINRNAIKATYYSANARQMQAVFNYERSILNAYLDVLNQLGKVDNYNKSYESKSKEVAILVKSIDISNSLFNSARADYMEILLTQREALESNMELLEIKLKQLSAKVSIYRALGGGWTSQQL